MTETFRNLVAWQKAKALAIQVYVVTREFPREEIYGLTAQSRRAAVSVMSNTAEGKGRDTKRDFCHFLMHARGFLYELESQIDLASDLQYVSKEDSKHLLGSCDEVGRVLNGLIKSMR